MTLNDHNSNFFRKKIEDLENFYMMLLFVLWRFSQAAYYITEGGFSSYIRCESREELIEQINSIDLSQIRLPEILIDEDLEIECNELPMFLSDGDKMKRNDEFPAYRFLFNKTEGRAVLTLDTSSSDDDNCPGLKFSNIDLVVKGEYLSTGYITFSKDTSVTIDPGFVLDTVKAEMPVNFLSNFSNISFCRMILCDSSTSIENITFSYDISMPQLNMKLKHGEPNMFDISLARNTTVLFENQQMIMNFKLKERNNMNLELIVNLPEMLNYSNAFYFKIVNDNVSFRISGNINYTTSYPHYLYFIQNDFTKGHDIYFGEGNYLNSYGHHFNISTGTLFELTVFSSSLHWNNEHEIVSLSLTDVVFYPESRINLIHEMIRGTVATFLFSGDSPIQSDLNLICEKVDIKGVLRSNDYKINITTSEIESQSVIEGNVYFSGEISVKVNTDIFIENLTFINNPVITYVSGIGKFKVNNLYGKFQIISELVTSKKFYNVIYVENIDSYNLNEITFIPKYPEYQFLNKNNQYIGYEVIQIPKTTIKLDVSKMEWPKEYEKTLSSITFRATSNVTIDLTCICSSTKILVSPSKKDVIITFIVPQNVSDFITYWGFGSTTGNPFTIKWQNSFIVKNEFFCRYTALMDSSYSLLDFSEVSSFTIDRISQLETMKNFIQNIPLIIILFDKSNNCVKNITFIDNGWLYETTTESGIITGINHTNITLDCHYTDRLTNKLFLDMQTTKPSMIYIRADFGSKIGIIHLLGEWNKVNFSPIILDGHVRLETQFEHIPIDFDDRLWNADRTKSNNQLYLNRTSTQSIMEIRSTFHKLYQITITNDNQNDLFIEILNDATVGGYLDSLKFNGDIKIRLKKTLSVKDVSLTSFWSESNEIYFYQRSTFETPKYLDMVYIVWNFTADHTAPSVIQNAQNIAQINVLFLDDPDTTLTETEKQYFYQPFLLADARVGTSCNELLSKLDFNSFNLTYGNDTILFNIICDDIIFTTDPYLFNQHGVEIPKDFYSIGLYINGTDHFYEEDINESQEEEKGTNIGLIVGFSIGAVLVTLVCAGTTVFIITRRKERIDNYEP
ncbi:hypothetical protein TRFO_11088 [Tritrichomonas foetus]|uniref:Uncharacterized protein n=1 Tax=Tritrichomonas foetus TaxID=1144522 RepID=A0A1J4J737_9EUKA|nr:hypothetical protein TRFO_11088 [Tritrichomonas foetus]|eukprot:OHS94473.1 hypothetical protein TRFO_11088 [Tritrichomonas foetus]